MRESATGAPRRQLQACCGGAWLRAECGWCWPSRRRSQAGRSIQSGGQVADGVVPGTGDHDAPARPGLQHEAALQGRDQAGTHQRRFAGSRAADHHQESSPARAAEKFVDLRFATEEEMLLVGFEGTQTWEWVRQRFQSHRPFRPLFQCFRPAMNCCSRSAEKPSSCARTMASWVRKRSFSGVRGGATTMPTNGAGLVRP